MRAYHSVKREKYLQTVLHLHFIEGYGVSRISEYVPLNPTTIYEWIRTFADKNPYKSYAMKRKQSVEPSDKSCQEETSAVLRRRIKELEKQLTNAEIRAEAYKTMVEVAESMGMPVRKKAGAKQ